MMNTYSEQRLVQVRYFADNNIVCESFNKWNVEARYVTLIVMLHAIR